MARCMGTLLARGMGTLLWRLLADAFLTMYTCTRRFEGHSRSILRSPCVAVHHSTTSIVPSLLRWVCTTSAMSA
jgi:hypothetical protein